MNEQKTEKMEYFISLLDDYMDDKVDENQIKELRKALVQDPFLNEVLKQHVQARANMRIAGEVELRNRFASSFEPIATIPEKKSNLTKILVAVFLILALAVGAYYLYSN